MTIDNNIELVKDFYRLIEENDYEAVKTLCHDDFTAYFQVDTPLNTDDFLTQEKGIMDGFPGFTLRIHDVFAHDDKVACYMMYEGVHTVDIHDLPATNNSVRISLMMLLTIRDGKIFEKRAHYDKANLFQQLNR